MIDTNSKVFSPTDGESSLEQVPLAGSQIFKTRLQDRSGHTAQSPSHFQSSPGAGNEFQQSRQIGRQLRRQTGPSRNKTPSQITEGASASSSGTDSHAASKQPAVLSHCAPQLSSTSIDLDEEDQSQNQNVDDSKVLSENINDGYDVNPFKEKILETIHSETVWPVQLKKVAVAPANTELISEGSVEQLGGFPGNDINFGPLEATGSIQDEKMGSQMNTRDNVEHLTENNGAAELMNNDDGQDVCQLAGLNGEEKSKIFPEHRENGEQDEPFGDQLLGQQSNVISPKATAQAGSIFKSRYNQKHKKQMKSHLAFNTDADSNSNLEATRKIKKQVIFSQDVENNTRSQEGHGLMLQPLGSNQGTEDNQLLAFPLEHANQEYIGSLSSNMDFKRPNMHQITQSNLEDCAPQAGILVAPRRFQAANNLDGAGDASAQGGSGQHGSNLRKMSQTCYSEENTPEYNYSSFSSKADDVSKFQNAALSTNSMYTSLSAAKKRVQLKRKLKIKQWADLHTQLKFPEECVDEFKSLKDIMKDRCQFNKAQRDAKHKIEKRYNLVPDCREMLEHKQRAAALPRTQKAQEKKPRYLEADVDHTADKKQELAGWQRWNAEYEEQLMKITDECTFYVHGKYMKFSKRSLAMLDNKNRFRIALVYLVKSPYFENVITFFITVNSILLGLKDYNPTRVHAASHNDLQLQLNKFIEESESVFTYIFFFECAAKVLAMGFAFGKNCYIQDPWNWLDFTVVLASLLTQLPSMKNISGFRTFRLFRPLRSISTMPSMKLLIGTLLQSLMHLGGILGLAMFFFMIFAILGVSLWVGLGHYRCYETQWPAADGTWKLVEGDMALCGGVRQCPAGTFCGSKLAAAKLGRLNMTMYPSDDQLWADTDIAELNYGLTNFDDLPSAFLTIFQCITMEGWTTIMNIYEDVYSSVIVDLYFICCVVICSFFLLNLTIAVMLMKYEELDKNQAKSKHKQELRDIGDKFGLPKELITFLIKQDSIQLSNDQKAEDNSMLKNNQILHDLMKKNEQSFCQALFNPKEKHYLINEEHQYYRNPIVKTCLRVVAHPHFDAFILMVIVANTILLAFDQYPELDADVAGALAYANHFFTLVFGLEVLFKIVGLGFKQFIKEKFNQVDLAIVILSSLQMVLQDLKEPGVFSACRAFRLFKIFKLFKAGDLRILLDSIAFTMTSISDYVILLCLFIYVTALLGMSYFAGTMKFDKDDKVDQDNGQSPRANFDLLPQTLLTIFQVLLTEGWNKIMYACMRTSGPATAIYFICLVLFGNIIMLNLFLAILLGNFEKARNFGRKKQVFEAFHIIMSTGKSLNQSLDIILGDMSIHVKTKILMWDERMVNKTHTVGETEIAQEMLEIGAKFMVTESDDDLVDDNMCEKAVDMSYQQEDEEDEAIDKRATRNQGSRARYDMNASGASKGAQDGKPVMGRGPSISRESVKGKRESTRSNVAAAQFAEMSNTNVNVAADMKFAKTVKKLHNTNPKLHRLREMNRNYKLTPSQAMKAILEKEMELGQYSMESYGEFELNLQQADKNSSSSQLKRFTTVNTAKINQNIIKFQESDQYMQTKQRCDQALQESTRSIIQAPEWDRKVGGQQQALPLPATKNGEEKSVVISIRDSGSQQERQSQRDLLPKSIQEVNRSINSSVDQRGHATSAKKGRAKYFNEIIEKTAKDKRLTKDKHSSSREIENKGSFQKLPESQDNSSIEAERIVAEDSGHEDMQAKAQNQKRPEASSGAQTTALLKPESTESKKRTSSKRYPSQGIGQGHTSPRPLEEDDEGDDDRSEEDGHEDLVTESKELFEVDNSTYLERLCDRLSNSSLFIFHKDSKLRRICLLLVESPESLAGLAVMESSRRFESANLDDEEVPKFGNTWSPNHCEPLDFDDQASKNSNSRSQKEGSVGKSKRIALDLVAPTKGHDAITQMLSRASLPAAESNLKRHPSEIFENIVQVLIVLSSVTLVVDNPLKDPNTYLMVVVRHAELVINILFTIEATIKIIGKGLLHNKLGPVQPYLKSHWNVLDFFVVAGSLVDLGFEITGVSQQKVQSLQALKALRALRGLRPLKVIQKNEGMKLVANALVASVPSMANVLLVCSLFILIFSIMGVNFFKGTFYRCQDSWEALAKCKDTDVQHHHDSPCKIDMDLINTKQDCLDQGGVWENTHQNFDNTLAAMNTLFQMTTTEGWIGVMYSGIDSRGVGLQPKENANVYVIAFFLAFMVMGSQFIINLFVGVVIDNFNAIKEQEELGNMFVTEQQKSWIEIQKIGLGKTLKMKINEPTGFRLPFFRLVTHTSFEYSMTSAIVMNTMVMASKHYQMSQELVDFSDVSNSVFAFIFNCEMILKLIGLGKIYFLYRWNNFDMFIVIATDLGILLNLLNVGGGFSTAATVIRGFRIMRMFRLIKSSVHIRLILDTIVNILPQITNVMALLLLLLFIFAALAVNLFSGVMLQDHLDAKNNFRTFPGALIILMKFSTGEGWNQYMYELAELEGHRGTKCMESQTRQEMHDHGIIGCGSWLAYPFFIAFTILVSLLIMNLSVAAVIEGLDTAKKENMGIVQGDEIEALMDLWQDYDPQATGWITIDDLVFLLYELPPPLGRRQTRVQFDDANYGPADKKNTGLRQQDRYLVNYEKRIVMKKVDALDLLKDLKIKVYSHSVRQIHFVDVFKALLKRIFHEHKIDFKLSSNLNRKMKNQWQKKHRDVVKDTRGKMTVREEQAAIIIAKWARKILNMQKHIQMFKKLDKGKGQVQKKKVHDQYPLGEAQAAVDTKKRRQEVLKEQAQVIYNIIQGVDDSEDGPDNQKKKQQYNVKNEYTWKSKGGRVLIGELEQECNNFVRKSSESGGELTLEQKQNSSELWLPGFTSEYNNDLFTSIPMGRDDREGSSIDRGGIELPALAQERLRPDGDAGIVAEEDQKYSGEGSLMQSIESTMFLYQDGSGVTPTKRKGIDRRQQQRTEDLNQVTGKLLAKRFGTYGANREKISKLKQAENANHDMKSGAEPRQVSDLRYVGEALVNAEQEKKLQNIDAERKGTSSAMMSRKYNLHPGKMEVATNNFFAVDTNTETQILKDKEKQVPAAISSNGRPILGKGNFPTTIELRSGGKLQMQANSSNEEDSDGYNDCIEVHGNHSKSPPLHSHHVAKPGSDNQSKSPAPKHFFKPGISSMPSRQRHKRRASRHSIRQIKLLNNQQKIIENLSKMRLMQIEGASDTHSGLGGAENDPACPRSPEAHKQRQAHATHEHALARLGGLNAGLESFGASDGSLHTDESLQDK